MAGDLHTHTTYSDGSTPIAQLPKMAAALGLEVIAVSDHDTMLSVRYAYQNPVQNGVRLIPATELTAYDYEYQHRVHLLAYFPDDCPAMQAHCDIMAKRRNEVHLQSAAELEEIYPQFKTEDALQYAADSGVLYKSGMMRQLQELGLADNMYGTLYKELFGLTPRGTVIHQAKYEPLETVLDTLKQSRAVVVVAHPSVYKTMPRLRKLCAEGKIDGIEIEHPRNTEEDKEECRQLVKQYGLIATGGTDFHGLNTKKPNPLATCTTPMEEIERIIALAKQRKN